MSNITYWPFETSLPLPVSRVLDCARECQAVLVLGQDANGDLYAASSLGDKATVLYWLEQFRHKLLAGDFDG